LAAKGIKIRKATDDENLVLAAKGIKRSSSAKIAPVEYNVYSPHIGRRKTDLPDAHGNQISLLTRTCLAHTRLT